MIDVKKVAHNVLEIEMQGLDSLYNNLPKDLEAVCKLLLNLKGKLIVTGMGKSGHIGKKIAAMLASTGTVSYFVHPSEALHGDLGMISKEDAVLAISASGKAKELEGVLYYAKRFNIPVIALTAGKDSPLAKASDYLLSLPEYKEACALEMIPTTSSTLTLVIGDIITACLIELKDFTAENFKVFHPGGDLGSKLLKVEDIMHKEQNIPLVQEGADMKSVVIEMTKKNLGCVGIINNDAKVIGIITDGDLRRNMQDDFMALSPLEIMTKDFIFINKDDFATSALRVMNEKKITSLFVLNEEAKAIGVLHMQDCLRSGVA